MRHVVCSNGAYAWDMRKDALVWETQMTPRLVAEIVSQLCHVFPDVTFGWETRSGIGFEDRFLQLAGGAGELESGGTAGDPWSQCLYKLYVRRSKVLLLDFQHELAVLLADSDCEITTSGAPFVEITAKESHKGSGLEKTATMLDFTAADTIVFGDNHNDLPMFGWAGHAVAMGNALNVVKDRAQAVTLPNTEHGVARYLESMLESGQL